jgi:hypothetical protein
MPDRPRLQKTTESGISEAAESSQRPAGSGNAAIADPFGGCLPGFYRAGTICEVVWWGWGIKSCTDSWSSLGRPSAAQLVIG